MHLSGGAPSKKAILLPCVSCNMGLQLGAINSGLSMKSNIMLKKMSAAERIGKKIHLKKPVEGNQYTSHGELVRVDEVESLCHGYEDLIIHSPWHTLSCIRMTVHHDNSPQ